MFARSSGLVRELEDRLLGQISDLSSFWINSDGPWDRQESPQPSSLLLTVTASPNLNLLRGLRERIPAFKVLENFSVANRLSCLETEPAFRLEPLHLLAQARIHHGLDPRVDPTI